jgi:hypothetical protein
MLLLLLLLLLQGSAQPATVQHCAPAAAAPTLPIAGSWTGAAAAAAAVLHIQLSH